MQQYSRTRSESFNLSLTAAKHIKLHFYIYDKPQAKTDEIGGNESTTGPGVKLVNTLLNHNINITFCN